MNFCHEKSSAIIITIIKSSCFTRSLSHKTTQLERYQKHKQLGTIPGTEIATSVVLSFTIPNINPMEHDMIYCYYLYCCCHYCYYYYYALTKGHRGALVDAQPSEISIALWFQLCIWGQRFCDKYSP